MANFVNNNNVVVSNDGSFMARNFMSAEALKERENNSTIDFIPNPKKEGSLFFTCGSISSGYISPAVKEAYKAGNLKLSDMKYAECSKDGGETWVPTLMINKGNAPVASF